MKIASPKPLLPEPTVAAAPSAVSPAPAPLPAGPVEDAPVSAAEIITTVVAVALKKSPKDLSFDSSVKALSGGTILSFLYL